MDDHRQSLKALLRQWHDLEPSPAFDQEVLRRVRQEKSESADRLGAWTGRLTSGWGLAAAAAAAVFIGLLLAMATPFPGRERRPAADPVDDLLAVDSVAGSYVAMLNQGGR